MTTLALLPPVPAPEATVMVASGRVRHHQHSAYPYAHPLCGAQNHGWQWFHDPLADALTDPEVSS